VRGKQGKPAEAAGGKSSTDRARQEKGRDYEQETNKENNQRKNAYDCAASGKSSFKRKRL